MIATTNGDGLVLYSPTVSVSVIISLAFLGSTGTSVEAVLDDVKSTVADLINATGTSAEVAVAAIVAAVEQVDGVVQVQACDIDGAASITGDGGEPYLSIPSSCVIRVVRIVPNQARASPLARFERVASVITHPGSPERVCAAALTILDTIRGALGIAPREQPAIQEPASEAAPIVQRSQNAIMLLESAMRCSLRDAANSAAGRARAGMAVGRVGAYYPNPYSAGIANKLAECEATRDSAKAQLDATRARNDVPELLRPATDDGEARLLAKIEDDYRAADERVAVIIALGEPLARRASLLDQIVEAEGERIAAQARLDAVEPRYAAAIRPLDPNHLPFDGEIQQRAALVVSVVDARAAVETCESRLFAARYALTQWSQAYPAIAASLARP